jgi:hypothetical protein
MVTKEEFAQVLDRVTVAGKDGWHLAVADGVVYASVVKDRREAEGETSHGGVIHWALPFDVVLGRMREIWQGAENAIGYVILFIPSDTGPDTDKLRAIILAASQQVGFNFLALPGPMTGAELVTAWQEARSRPPRQKVPPPRPSR